MRRRWLALAGVALATLSCQLILNLEEPTGTPLPPEEEPDTGPPDPCKHAAAPKKTGKDDDPDTKKTYWFATKSVGPRAPGQGYDLDKACTCGADLHNGDPPCNSPKPVCDDDGGIDDAVSALFGDVSKQFPFDPLKPVNSAFTSGGRTLLLYITDYNGKPNDADVTVGFVNAGGLYTDVGCDDQTPRGSEITFGADDAGVHTPPGMNRYRPAFDGCDHWSPETGLVVKESRVPTVKSGAYVANNQLVISIDSLTTGLFGNSTTLSTTLFVAKFSQEGEHLRLDGILAGRLPFKDLTQTLGGNEVGSFGGGDDDGGYTAVCDVPFIWNQATPRLCEARDTMATPSQDFKAKSCDATSLNFAFSLVEAKLAPFDFTNSVLSKVCPPVDCPP